MKRVTGIGGVFFKANNPDALYDWYARHLGLERDSSAGAVLFPWRNAADPEGHGMTVWSIFPANTKYFGSGTQPFMMNFCVENLEELLKALREEGVQVDDNVQVYDYGKFAWITDPEGNRIELWEPGKE